MNTMEHRCGVCESHGKDGFHLLSMWLCKDCERAIVTLDVEHLEYDWYVQQLRKSKMNVLLAH